MTQQLSSDDRQLRGGCIRYVDENGVATVAHPRDALYSTLVMIAQFYWSERLQCWMPVESDDES